MPFWHARARPPRASSGASADRQDDAAPGVSTDPAVLAAFAEDAAHFPGGHAAAVATPRSEVELVDLLLGSRGGILPVGAQSSLTGGATPRGEVIVSTRKLNAIQTPASGLVRVGAGVALSELDEALALHGMWYPPVPTFTGAFVGGVVATNAAGAATFKYGATRDWVEALTVVLATGDVLDIERGATRAHPDGYFELELARGVVRVPVPRYARPALPKLSAGYFSGHEMDLIDLFIGAEGTLGIVTEATLRVLAGRPATCTAFVPCRDRARAMALATRLRQDAVETWRARDPLGLDISAIEHMDARSLALVHQDGMDRVNGVSFPLNSALALLVTLELPGGIDSAEAFRQIGAALEPGAPDTPLVRFSRLFAEGLDVDIAVPGDRQRAAQLLAIREAVPSAVNRRVARAGLHDPRIEKVAGDLIVPFDRLETLLDRCDEVFVRLGLDFAVWGHISDGNIHPNVIPRDFADVEAGKAAIRELGRASIELGGAPLAEHGVGRNEIKQELLLFLYGAEGIEDMKRTKRALDPEWRLAPGVIFEFG
jgi:D-lactate dehydrogenase (cytochrome)